MRVQPYAQNGRVLQALRYYKLLSSTFDEWLIKYSNYKENQELTKKHLPLYNTKEVFDIFDNESYEKCVIEYISGMTDQFAIQVYEEIITFWLVDVQVHILQVRFLQVHTFEQCVANCMMVQILCTNSTIERLRQW